MKYVIPYIKALGKPSVVLIFIFFACFKICEVAQSIWVKEWTNNDDLKNFTSMPGDSEERQKVNSYYIWVYASIGLFQGKLCSTAVIFIFYENMVIYLA